jgi:hypothetical protein
MVPIASTFVRGVHAMVAETDRLDVVTTAAEPIVKVAGQA